MSKVYCLLGKSCAGKDTLLNLIVNKGFKRVISHTSRPIRSNEVNHIDYHFTTKDTMIKMLSDNEFVEVRTYNVANGDTWYYGIAKDSIDLNSDGDYICIVDGEGFKSLQNHYGKENILGIYLWIHNRERLLRALHRSELSDTDVDEIVRRYMADDRDFTKEIINRCILKINNVNINETLDIVLRNIKSGL
jgi:guanylate kinase